MNPKVIIMYEGDNSTFIWKHSCEDFISSKQLIVNESQEAILYVNGQALDLYGPGRYNFDDIRQSSSLSGKEYNYCHVYFINKTILMGVKWGTDSKVRFMEPTLGVPIEIIASGEMNLKVVDSRKLLIKLVGTMNGIAWNDNNEDFAKSLDDSFRPFITTAVKTHLASSIKTENINIFEIDENLEKLSEILRVKIKEGFEEYGLTIPQFYITDVVFPENDPNYKKLKEVHSLSLQKKLSEVEASVIASKRNVETVIQETAKEVTRHEAERKLIKAEAEAKVTKMAGLAEAEVMKAKGYDHKDVLEVEVQKAYAEGLCKMGDNAEKVIKTIKGFKIISPANLNDIMEEDLSNITSNSKEKTISNDVVLCSKCGQKLPANVKFCFECGKKM